MQIKDPFETKTSKTILAKELQVDLRRVDDPAKTVFREYLFVKLVSDINQTTILLSSEKDLFFHYSAVVNATLFGELKVNYDLLVTYEDFSAFVAKLLTQALKDPNTIQLVLVLDEHGNADLRFVENFKGYKFVEILRIPFEISDEEVIRCDVTHRYLSLKAQNKALQEQLKNLQKAVQMKLPGLLE